MATLTGRLAYVTGGTVPASAIRQVTVRAPAPRAAGTALITTWPVPVGADGVLTVNLEPGPATLIADLDTGHSTFDLLVEVGMTTIHAAAQAAIEHRR